MRVSLRQLALSLLLASSALAAPARVAVVFGHNGGDGPRAPLRFAESDAARVAQVFKELAQVAPDDVKLLQGRPISELLAAFEWARARVEGRDAVLLVYVSAHADAARGLLPGKEQLEWKQLKTAITATGARLRVTIVDGCESSGLLEAGARPAPTFSLDAKELTMKGEVFITSSASNEPSLEAGAFRGSVFTQHLVAGLRGAADKSGDGRVSLDEAYRFAFERTQEGASGQHAGFASRLVGYGDVALTSLDRAAGLMIPEGTQSILVRTAQTNDPVVLVRGAMNPKLALPIGRYRVELERSGTTREGNAVVAAGTFSPIDPDQLGLVTRHVQLVRLEAQAESPTCFKVTVERATPLLLELQRRLTDTECAAPVPLTLSFAESAVVITTRGQRTRLDVTETDELVLRIKALANPQ
jgi:hypothetical protein